LIEAGEGLRSQRRWEEAVDAFRKLAVLGLARGPLWRLTEAARQAGMASLVLEALSAQARWHVEAGAVRRPGKPPKMLLVDPKNDLAAEILSQVGSTSREIDASGSRRSALPRAGRRLLDRLRRGGGRRRRRDGNGALRARRVHQSIVRRLPLARTWSPKSIENTAPPVRS
jgi:hypothetical protein